MQRNLPLTPQIMSFSRRLGLALFLFCVALLLPSPAHAKKDPVKVVYDKALDVTNYNSVQTFQKKNSGFFSRSHYKMSLLYIVNFSHPGQTPRPVDEVTFGLARQVVETNGASAETHKSEWDGVDAVAFVAGGHRFTFSTQYNSDFDTNDNWLTGFSSGSWERVVGTVSIEDFKSLASAPEADYSLLNGESIVDTGHMDDKDLSNLRAMATKLPVGSTSVGKDASMNGLPVGETISKTQDDPLTQNHIWVSYTKVEDGISVGVFLKEHKLTDKVENDKRNIGFTIAKRRDKLNWQDKKLVIRVGDEVHEYSLLTDNIIQDGAAFEMAIAAIPIGEFKKFMVKDTWVMRIGDDLSDTISLNPMKVKCLVDAAQKIQEQNPEPAVAKEDATATPETATTTPLQPQLEAPAK